MTTAVDMHKANRPPRSFPGGYARYVVCVLTLVNPLSYLDRQVACSVPGRSRFARHRFLFADEHEARRPDDRLL